MNAHNDITDTKINRIENDTKLIAKEVELLTTLLEKLNVAVEKMGDVYQTTSRLLAIHDEKIQNQEKATEKIMTKIDKNKEDMDAKMDSILEKIEASKNKHEEDDKKKYHLVEERLSKLERFMWILSGSGFIIGFLASVVFKSTGIIKIFTGL